MGHPDFRVGGRIFATLGYQNEGRGVLLLSPEEQQEMNNATYPRSCDEECLAEESSQTIEQASASLGDLLELAPLAIFADAVPGKTLAVHGNVNTCRQHLHERERAA